MWIFTGFADLVSLLFSIILELYWKIFCRKNILNIKFKLQGLTRLVQIVLTLLHSGFFIINLIVGFVTYIGFFWKNVFGLLLKPTRPSSVVVHNNPGAVILKVKSTWFSSFEPIILMYRNHTMLNSFSRHHSTPNWYFLITFSNYFGETRRQFE